MKAIALGRTSGAARRRAARVRRALAAPLSLLPTRRDPHRPPPWSDVFFSVGQVRTRTLHWLVSHGQHLFHRDGDVSWPGRGASLRAPTGSVGGLAAVDVKNMAGYE